MHNDIWICLLHSALWICKKIWLHICHNGEELSKNLCIRILIYIWATHFELKNLRRQRTAIKSPLQLLPIKQYISLVMVIEVGENCLFRKPKLHILDTFRWMWSLTKIILNTFISWIMMFKLVDVNSIHWHRCPHSTYNTVLQLE